MRTEDADVLMGQMNGIAENFTNSLEDIDTAGMLRSFLELEMLFMDYMSKKENLVTLQNFVEEQKVQIDAAMALLPDRVSYRTYIDRLKESCKARP